MRHRTLTLTIVLLLFAVATGAAQANRTERHSGLVAAIDPEGAVMLLDEVGPWRLERGATAVTRDQISLTPATKYNLYMRVNVPGAFAGDFIEVMLEPTDVVAGDFVTAECVREGGRLVALSVTVAELPIGDTR